MKTSFCGLAMILAALGGTSVAAEPSAYQCSKLETSPSMPSIEGLEGVFYRVQSDLRMWHPMEDAVMEQMGALSDVLAAGGTTLIYVTVPTKSQAMPQFLPPSAANYAFDSATATLVYDDIINRLSAHGVLAPNILTALLASDPDKLPFFQADFHWTSDGSRLAAKAIGALMKTQPFYGDLTLSEYHTTDLDPAAAFSTMRRILQTFCIGELPRIEAFNHLTEVSAGSVEGAADIFAGGDETVQVVLVGTSFSDALPGNFAGYLSEFSGLDVVNYAVTGGNQFGAMASYMVSRDFAENPPRFLIWENPIYNNLAQFGPDPIDELIAAAGQTCSVPLAVTQSDANSLTADLTSLKIERNDVILADLGTNGPREALFTFTTSSGTTRKAEMRRTDRMLASGRFFKPLGSIWHPDLTTLTVTFDRPVTPTSTLTFCPASRKDTAR